MSHSLVELENLNILFYDGYCNLCHGAVRFVNKWDKKRHIYFAPLKGITADAFNLSLPHNTLVYSRHGKCFTESSAVLEVAYDLGGLWRFTYFFRIIPRVLRDGLYRFIARNRYRWFGVNDACETQNLSDSGRFLS